jgi:hypothetical protein
VQERLRLTTPPKLFDMLKVTLNFAAITTGPQCYPARQRLWALRRSTRGFATAWRSDGSEAQGLVNK